MIYQRPFPTRSYIVALNRDSPDRSFLSYDFLRLDKGAGVEKAFLCAVAVENISVSPLIRNIEFTQAPVQC